MKLGNSLLIIVVVLIGFGFLLSDNHHLNRELQEVNTHVAEANKIAAVAGENLKVCQAEQSSQKSQIEILQAEALQLKAEISELQAKNAELEKENSLLLPNRSEGSLVNLDPLAAEIIVAVQVLLALVQRLNKSQLGVHMSRPGNREKNRSVQVTEEELNMIIEKRRKK